MRALTKNERALAIAFGAMVFVIGNLVLLRWVSQELRDTRSEVVRIEAEIDGHEALIAERPFWEARQAWMVGNPVDEYSPGESDLAFAEQVQAGVEGAGLKVESQELRETTFDGGLVVASLELDLRGELEALVRWLQGFQQPGSYVRIERFTLKRADASSTMRLQVRVSKVFRGEAEVAQTP